MAVQLNLYNNATKRLIDQSLHLNTLKVMLLDNTAAFDGTNTTLAQVAGTPTGSTYPKEWFGNNWPQGGPTVANVTVTTVTTNDAMLDGDDISITATGGPIGPTYNAVLYDSTDANKAPLAFISFGASQQAGQDTDFKIVWPASGIIAINY